jgi:hypothetical protein
MDKPSHQAELSQYPTWTSSAPAAFALNGAPLGFGSEMKKEKCHYNIIGMHLFYSFHVAFYNIHFVVSPDLARGVTALRCFSFI